MACYLQIKTSKADCLGFLYTMYIIYVYIASGEVRRVKLANSQLHIDCIYAHYKHRIFSLIQRRAINHQST